MMKIKKNKTLYSNLKKQYEDLEAHNKIRKNSNEVLKQELKNNFLEQEARVQNKHGKFFNHTRNK